MAFAHVISVCGFWCWLLQNANDFFLHSHGVVPARPAKNILFPSTWCNVECCLKCLIALVVCPNEFCNVPITVVWDYHILLSACSDVLKLDSRIAVSCITWSSTGVVMSFATSRFLFLLLQQGGFFPFFVSSKVHPSVFYMLYVPAVILPLSATQLIWFVAYYQLHAVWHLTYIMLTSSCMLLPRCAGRFNFAAAIQISYGVFRIWFAIVLFLRMAQISGMHSLTAATWQRVLDILL